METLNKAELIGIVGNIRIASVGEGKIARLTLATNEVFKSKSGDTVIETTWHNVSAVENSKIESLDKIEKGDMVKVLGRLRMTKYTGADGTEHFTYEVVAHELERVA